MQVVIDINDNTYETIKHEYCVLPPRKGLLKVLWDAIQNGTPLPKGHGDLIDRNELIKNGIATKDYLNTFIDTIIKADEGDK